MIIKRHVITCYISRNIPFSIKSIENILFYEHENLDCLLNDIETDEGYEATIIVEVNMFVRLHHFNYYEDDEFSTFTFNFRSDDVVDHTTIDNIADVMRAAHREIYSCMDDESLVQLAQGEAKRSNTPIWLFPSGAFAHELSPYPTIRVALLRGIGPIRSL